MRIEHGELTVGDVGVPIIAYTDQTLTSLNIDFELVFASGAVKRRDASSISGTTATYNTAAGDIEESGEMILYLYNATSGFYYNKEKGNRIPVRPKPQDMARAR